MICSYFVLGVLVFGPAYFFWLFGYGLCDCLLLCLYLMFVNWFRFKFGVAYIG